MAFIRKIKGALVRLDSSQYVGEDTYLFYDIVTACLRITDGTPGGRPACIEGYVQTSEIGQPGGVAGLDGTGTVPASQLPSYVDDVIEFADLASFPVTGETGIIYVALDSNVIYRWSGTAYVAIGGAGGGALSGLTDTTITGVTDNELLAWDITGGVWINQTPAEAGLADAAHTHTDEEVAINFVSGATYTTVEDSRNLFHSAGHVSGGEFTDIGSLQITVAAGTGFLRDTTDSTSALTAIDWPETTLSGFTPHVDYYIEATLNAGVPEIQAIPNTRPSCNTHIHLGEVISGNTVLHLNETTRFHISDGPRLLTNRLQQTQPFSHVSGAIISETGTRNIALTAGTFWEALTKFSTTAFDSSVTDAFTYTYGDGIGGWTNVGAQTQINNINYDDGTGTLGPLTVGKYGISWVYLETDSHCRVLYGTGDYTITEAQDAQPPADVPPGISIHGRLIGKIIIGQGASTFAEILSSFGVLFTGSSATDHLSLLNIGTNTHAQIDTHIADVAQHPTLLNNLTNVNTTPAGGDVLYYNSTATEWQSTQLFVEGAKQTIQSAFGTIPALSGTAIVILASTAPLVTEGVQLWSHVFTPSQTGGEIKISQSLAFLVTNAASDFVVTLFRDNVCIGVMNDSAANGGAFQTISFMIKDPAVLTGGVPVTYSARVGKTSGGATWYVNSHDTIATVFGGLLTNNAYTIEEVVTL